jgi:hypothetical protein
MSPTLQHNNISIDPFIDMQSTAWAWGAVGSHNNHVATHHTPCAPNATAMHCPCCGLQSMVTWHALGVNPMSGGCANMQWGAVGSHNNHVATHHTPCAPNATAMHCPCCGLQSMVTWHALRIGVHLLRIHLGLGYTYLGYT